VRTHPDAFIPTLNAQMGVCMYWGIPVEDEDTSNPMAGIMRQMNMGFNSMGDVGLDKQYVQLLMKRKRKMHGRSSGCSEAFFSMRLYFKN
jgi:hypothetical protein